MIGRLTIDKASMNLSYFLFSIRIIASSGGKISRKEFVSQMADFAGLPKEKDGKENRTPYNKSKLPRYFGLIDIDNSDKSMSYLVLTNRGKIVDKFIQENKEEEPSKRFSINPFFRNDFVNLVFESLVFDSFGKNNCGAEQSNTDVEPPKVIFKTIQELGSATTEEILYVMFGLNNGLFEGFKEAIKAVQTRREKRLNDYTCFMDKWGLQNIVEDCKLIGLFTDEAIQLLTVFTDEDGKKKYQLHLDKEHQAQLKKVSAFYTPLRMIFYSKAGDLDEWINESVLGKVSNEEFVFQYTEAKGPFLGYRNATGYVPGYLDSVLVKAFSNPKRNVYLVIKDVTEESVTHLFGRYCSLIAPKQDFKNDFHGWSEHTVFDSDCYNYLLGECKDINKSLPKGGILLPSNIQIIGLGTITGENMSFDYTFSKAKVLVENCSENQNNADFETKDEKRVNPSANNQPEMGCLDIIRNARTTKINPLNFIVYGAPGTGKTYAMAEYALAILDDKSIDEIRKSYTERTQLMTRYNSCIKNGQIVFTTFHQSYGYEEFIQGLRPDTESDQLVFKKTEGVFKQIADKALRDTSGKNYVIIIDEINRANISKVFGELITLIEEDKRWGEVNQICVTLQSGDVFAVPNNLYIIGTMNSADKSISLIDAALRRRFEFIEQYPDEGLVEDKTLKSVLNKLNGKLAHDLESSDLLIGHSYFMNKSKDDLCDILNHSVIPLLYEYYYDDKRKVNATLSDALKDLGYDIIDEKTRRIYVKKGESKT